MNLDTWRSINYIFQDLIVSQLFIVTGYAIFLKNSIHKRYWPIIYYLMGSTLIEITSKIILKLNDQSAYFVYNGYILVILELSMLYWFILNIISDNRIVLFLIIAILLAIITFYIFDIASGNSFPNIIATMPAFLNILFLSYILFTFNAKFSKKKFLKVPENIIIIAFLVSYLLLILSFFLSPEIIKYSKILANQFIILNHVISILFYGFIGYALSRKKM